MAKRSRTLLYSAGLALVAAAAVILWLLVRTEPQQPTPRLNGENPFGVTVDPRWPLDVRIRVARTVGARYFRTEEAYVKSWDQNPVCESCQAALDAGLEVTWTVRNTTKPEIVRPPDASTPPEDIEEYKRVIREVMDKYPIALLVVENEVTVPNHFTGTPRDYETMLRAACEVAHERDVPCATDGMIFTLAKRYTHYYLSCVAGDQDRAEAFRQNVGGLEEGLQCQAGGRPGRIAEWIDAYKSAQPDYVNIHWYAEPGSDPVGDAEAFAEAAEVFETLTGRPVITNEIGQRDENPEITTQLMRKVVEIGMPFCIWYSTESGARVLAGRDGNLRPNGEAFKSFIEEAS
jgi:hypothetical protein